MPCQIIANRLVEQKPGGIDASLGWILYPSYGGGDGPDDNLCYVLFDQALDGNGAFGYPQLAQTKGGSAVAGPAELLTIGGTGLSGSTDWLLRLTLGIYAFTIPAPGAVGVLGLAGVAAMRRRRG